MKKNFFYFTLAVLFLIVMIISCPSSSEGDNDDQDDKDDNSKTDISSSPGSGFSLSSSLSESSLSSMSPVLFTVTYDGNGHTDGKVPHDSSLYAEGDTVTVLDNTGDLEMNGFNFAGWSADSAASGEIYTAGDELIMGGADLKLYAVWKKYNIPTIVYASDAQASDNMGRAVSIWGDYAVAGAFGEDTGGNYAGAAYIYKNDNSNDWSQVDILHASDASASAQFGWSAGIYDDYIIIGARWESTYGSEAGGAYIYKNDGSDNWNEIEILHGSDTTADNNFGWSVSIYGDYAIVGAYHNDTIANNAGAAYIYKNDGSDNWTQITVLHASDAQDNDYFGSAVSIYGNYAVVGSYGEDTTALSAGAAYVYKNDGSDNWSEVEILHASDAAASNAFGYSASINNDYIIIGAYDEGPGKAYIFKNDGSDNWIEVALLQASDGETGDFFGYSVGIWGDFAVVGASAEATYGSSTGAAYIFHNDGSDNWTEMNILYASNPVSYGRLGRSVSIQGDNVIIGHEGDSVKANSAGAAYIFH